MFKNCTPHRIDIFNSDGEKVISVDPSGIVARVEMVKKYYGCVDGVTVHTTKMDEVVDLPEQTTGINLIVSRVVMELVKDFRQDVFCPGELLRNKRGQPIGCIGLSR